MDACKECGSTRFMEMTSAMKTRVTLKCESCGAVQETHNTNFGDGVQGAFIAGVVSGVIKLIDTLLGRKKV